MRRIERAEVLSLGEYEKVRPHFRARVVEEKRARRFSLGEHLGGVFENRDTVLLQIQEMLRTERITQEPGIEHEIATYNELVPGESELSLTLFVEIPDASLRDEMLVTLAGLERHVGLEVDGRPQRVRQEARAGAREDRTTAVHYFMISLDPEAKAAIVGGSARVAVVSSHPAYGARAELSPAAVESLARDLREPDRA